MEGARSLQGPVRMLKFLNVEIHLIKQFAFMLRGGPETTTDGHSLCTFSKHMAPFFFENMNPSELQAAKLYFQRF